MIESSKNIGYIHKQMLKKSNDNDAKFLHCISAARRFALTLDLAQDKFLKEGEIEKIIEDMDIITKELFYLISDQQDLDEKLKLSGKLVRTFDYFKSIGHRQWDHIVFQCFTNHIQIILNKVMAYLETEDFKSALIYIG